MPQWADNLDLLIQFTGRNYYPKSGIRHIAARLSKRRLWSEANTLELLATKDNLALKADRLVKVRKVRNERIVKRRKVLRVSPVCKHRATLQVGPAPRGQSLE